MIRFPYSERSMLIWFYFSSIFCIIHWFSNSTNNRYINDGMNVYLASFFLNNIFFIHSGKMVFIYSFESWIKSGYTHTHSHTHSPGFWHFSNHTREMWYVTTHIIAQNALTFHRIDTWSWYGSTAICAHLIPVLFKTKQIIITHTTPIDTHT